MKLGVGKWGKAIIFNKKNWGSIGGDNECPTLLINLFHSWPNTKFYLLSKSDYSRLDESTRSFINKNNNVVDLWQDWDKSIQIEFWVNHKLKDTILDAAILYTGPTGTSSIQGVSKLMNGEYSKILDSQRGYVGPLVWYFNNNPIPRIDLTADPRYFPLRTKDLNSRASINLGQFSVTKDKVVYKNYSEEVPIQETLELAQTESVFLIGRKLLPPTKKSVSMTILLNQGMNGAADRYPLLKEFILDNKIECDIYGKWSDEIYEAHPNIKRPIQFDQLAPHLRTVRSTFMIPIAKGWVTAKYLESIYFGMLPFMHHSYGPTGLPDFLYVKEPKELKDKLKMVESNRELYYNLYKDCEKLIKVEYLNGSYMRNLLLDSLDRLGIDTGKKSVEDGLQNQLNLF